MEASAVRELANIGLGHATTSLSELLGRPFNMQVPNVETVGLSRVSELMGDPLDLAVGIYMPISGDITGHLVFLFPWGSAQSLWKSLVGSSPDSPSDVDDLFASAALEIGNIINSSFLNAIADMTGLALHATPPLVSIDLGATIVSSVVAEAELEEVVALSIETEIFDTTDTVTHGYFLCVPTLGGLKLIFSRLGIPEAA